MYNAPCSSEPDDISLFLHEILLHSSSSPSSSYSPMALRGTPLQFTSPSRGLPENPLLPVQSPLLSGLERQDAERISPAESSSGLDSSLAAVFSSSGNCFPASAKNVSSSSVGTMDNEPDDYDCESEEGFETLLGEVPAKPVPPRNPSKRSRAAEVHNLSEKRRRKRINEKMKALQNLIPNSNKTDKASMLDEAIEYLKQLQLQVQMLTMRHGLSLYPMCQPGVLQPAQLGQMKMGFYEGNGTMNVDGTCMHPVSQEPTNTLFAVPKESSNSAHLTVANFSSIINSEASFVMESSIQSQLRPFQLPTSSEVKDICHEDMFPHQQLNVDQTLPNMLARVSVPFDTQTSMGKDCTPEECVVGAERPENLLPSNLSEPIHAAYLKGMCTGGSAKPDIKAED